MATDTYMCHSETIFCLLLCPTPNTQLNLNFLVNDVLYHDIRDKLIIIVTVMDTHNLEQQVNLTLWSTDDCNTAELVKWKTW